MRIILCLCVVFLGMFHPGAANSHSYGFTYNGNEYTFYKVKKSWEGARDACEDMGEQLATINSGAVHGAIISHIKAVAALTDAVGNGYWIGANDKDQEDTFVFVGTNAILTYNGWYNNQPNNNIKKNPDGQDCVQLWEKPGNNPQWKFDDAYCHKKKGYICEKPGVVCGPPDKFLCDDGIECFPGNWECDHIFDCSDGSDEAGCPCNEAGLFLCNNGCIKGGCVCDDTEDCPDGSDEFDCEYDYYYYYG